MSRVLPSRSPGPPRVKRRPITAEEIAASATPRGDFSAERLRSWGLSFPPRAGWRRRLVETGVPATCPYPAGFEPRELGHAFGANPLLDLSQHQTLAMPDDSFSIFTDGSGDAKSASGGWSFVVYRGETEIHASLGGAAATTNNRMELRAAIEALDWLGRDVPAILWTDSRYVLRGALEQRQGWRRDGWSRGGREDLANADLWREFAERFAGRPIDIRWTRGHAGETGNERADELAKLGRRLFAR